jgi:hypothetical protein
MLPGRRPERLGTCGAQGSLKGHRIGAAVGQGKGASVALHTSLWRQPSRNRASLSSAP